MQVTSQQIDPNIERKQAFQKLLNAAFVASDHATTVRVLQTFEGKLEVSPELATSKLLHVLQEKGARSSWEMLGSYPIPEESRRLLFEATLQTIRNSNPEGHILPRDVSLLVCQADHFNLPELPEQRSLKKQDAVIRELIEKIKSLPYTEPSLDTSSRVELPEEAAISSAFISTERKTTVDLLTTTSLPSRETFITKKHISQLLKNNTFDREAIKDLRMALTTQAYAFSSELKIKILDRLDGAQLQFTNQELAYMCRPLIDDVVSSQRGSEQEDDARLLEAIIDKFGLPQFHQTEMRTMSRKYLYIMDGETLVTEKTPLIERLSLVPKHWSYDKIQAAAMLLKLWPDDTEGLKDITKNIKRLKVKQPEIFDNELADFVWNRLLFDSLSSQWAAPTNLNTLSTIFNSAPAFDPLSFERLTEIDEKDAFARERKSHTVGTLLFLHLKFGQSLKQDRIDWIYARTGGMSTHELLVSGGMEQKMKPLFALLGNIKDEPVWCTMTRLGLRPSERQLSSFLEKSIESSASWRDLPELIFHCKAAKLDTDLLSSAAGMRDELEQASSIYSNAYVLSQQLSTGFGPLLIDEEERLFKKQFNFSRADLVAAAEFHITSLTISCEIRNLISSLEYLKAKYHYEASDEVLTKACGLAIAQNRFHKEALLKLREYRPSLPELEILRKEHEDSWSKRHSRDLDRVPDPFVSELSAALKKKSVYFCPTMYNDPTDSWGMFGTTEGFLVIEGRNFHGKPRTLGEDAWLNAKSQVLSFKLGGFTLGAVRHEDFFPKDPEAFFERSSEGSAERDLFKFKRYTFRSNDDGRMECFAILKALGVTLPRLLWTLSDAERSVGYALDRKDLNPDSDGDPTTKILKMLR